MFLLGFVSIVTSSVSNVLIGPGGLNPEFKNLITEIEQTLDENNHSIFKEIKEFFLPSEPPKQSKGVRVLLSDVFKECSKNVLMHASIFNGKTDKVAKPRIEGRRLEVLLMETGNLAENFNWICLLENIRDILKELKKESELGNLRKYEYILRPFGFLLTLIKYIEKQISVMDNLPPDISEFEKICDRILTAVDTSEETSSSSDEEEEITSEVIPIKEAKKPIPAEDKEDGEEDENEEGDEEEKGKTKKLKKKLTDDKESDGGPADSGTPSWLDRNFKIFIGGLVVFVGLSAVGLVFFLKKSKR